VRSPSIGIVGSGRLARAVGVGLGQPVGYTDGGSGAAVGLAADTNGSAYADNRLLAEMSDFLLLCHKPSQLRQVAQEVGGAARVVVSLLGGVSLRAVAGSYPDAAVLRVAVNLPAAVNRGVVLFGGAERCGEEEIEAVLAALSPLGLVFRLPEDQLPAAICVSGVGPAYLALVAEAQVDAAVRHGLPSELATRLAAQTLTGAGALLADGWDTLALRRAVASPGGTTARGLAALERARLRAAFAEAADAVAAAAFDER
jgi:pyrroline-5-carboxylate reductase